MSKKDKLYDYSFTEEEVIIICDALDCMTEDLSRMGIIVRSKLLNTTKLNEYIMWLKMFRFKIFDIFSKEREK